MTRPDRLGVAIVDPFLFTLPYDQALAGALAALGHRVFVIGRTLKAQEPWNVPDVGYIGLDFRVPDRLRGSAPAVYLPAVGLKYARRMVGLSERLAELAVDIVHFQWLPVPPVDWFVVRRIRRTLPLVLTAHDTVPFNSNPTVALQRLGSISILGLFDRLIVHTEQGVARLERYGVPRTRIARMPHGPLGPPSYTYDGAGAPNDAGPERRLRFLLFGAIKPYKGIDILIRAVQHMPVEVRQHCNFIVAGWPWMDVGELRTLAEACGVSSELAFIPRWFDDREIRALLREADVFVFPYREVEASGVLLLSLKFGRPIVASRIGIFDELLVHNRHGLLVEPDNPRALAEALTAIATDGLGRQVMGQQVAALAASIPRWSQIATCTTQLYAQAIETRTGGIRQIYPKREMKG